MNQLFNYFPIFERVLPNKLTHSSGIPLESAYFSSVSTYILAFQFLRKAISGLLVGRETAVIYINIYNVQ